MGWTDRQSHRQLESVSAEELSTKWGSAFTERTPFPKVLKNLQGLGDHAPQLGVLTGVSRSKGGERFEREQQRRRRMRAEGRERLRKTYD